MAKTIPSSPNRSVLIVEDDADSRFLYAEFVDMLGMKALEFPRYATALDQLRANKPEIALVILDLSLPGMTAEEFVAELRKTVGYEKTPLLALSGRNDIAARVEALGVDGFLKKPCDLDPLLKEIERLTRK